VNPEGIRTIGEFPNLTATMEKRGWKESRIRKIIGENWVRLLKDVWGN
jgi:membrane dipeptidase